mmetsp:Transcript_25384/g.59048  ORF Transcript_25384/g.59048 Transcript_25384/m.59048 type:complete len:383 (+) Transcript_25384:97-1245(+)
MGAGPSQLLAEVDRASQEVGAGSNEFASALRHVQNMLVQGKCSVDFDPFDSDDLVVAESETPFMNPVCVGEDPWIIQHEHNYYWCHAKGDNAIAISVASKLQGPYCQPIIVWQAPAYGPCSQQVWAPELHFLDGRFYIYFAASDGKNENHLMYVLRSEGKDALGPYSLHGPLATGDGYDGRSPNIWAIDLTVLKHQNQLYAVWSGWDQPGSDRQYLYIARMANPITIAGPRVRLSDNSSFVWERIEETVHSPGLNEGPQVLQTSGGRTFIVYSCGASWLPTYKLGLLELVGSDPLRPGAWKKHSQPAFRSSNATFGVGHSCFVPSPDKTELWHVYHTKMSSKPGWTDRCVFMQQMSFKANGVPDFGAAVKPGEIIQSPSGTN